MNGTTARNDDRRKSARLPLRLSILLLTPGSLTPISSQTTDISNAGFYCTSAEPLSPGEELKCLIALPILPSDPPTFDRLFLEADVDVVRLLVDNQGEFGIGCHIRQFHVVKNDSIPAWAHSGINEFAKSAK